MRCQLLLYSYQCSQEMEDGASRFMMLWLQVLSAAAVAEDWTDEV